MKNYVPITNWLPEYETKWLKNDLIAGLVVGILLIPQGMAYAMIAGLPPVFGLYASLVPQVIYALFGTSRQLAVGPVAMDSILVATGLGALSITGLENYVLMAITLAFIMGAIQFVMGWLKMGFVVNYLSKPVISGFTSAAAIIIGLSQLKYLLGVDIGNNKQVHQLLISAFQHISDIHVPTFLLGLTGILILIFIRKLLPGIPGALVVLVGGIGTVAFFHLNQVGVSIVGNIPEGLPSFRWTVLNKNHILDLLPIAATLSLVAFTEAISVGKAIEEKHDNYKIDPNQELIALGAANMVGSLFQSYSTTGGFSRTAVNDNAGAKSNLAAVISAGVIAVTLLFLTPLFYYLPHAVLASIIMVAVGGLIDLQYPKELYKLDKLEFALLAITFFTTLTVGIIEGIVVGVFLSLLLTVYKVSIPHVAVLGQIKGTDYYRNIHRFDEDVIERKDILILRFDAPLFFGNKEFFYQTIMKHIQARAHTKAVIINAESMNYIDSSATIMITQLLEDLQEKKIQFYISNAIGPVRDVLYKSGLFGKIGKENIFVRTCDCVAHIEGEERDDDYSHWIASQTLE